MTGESINKKNDLKLHCVDYSYNVFFNITLNNECTQANMSYDDLACACHLIFKWGPVVVVIE